MNKILLTATFTLFLLNLGFSQNCTIPNNPLPPGEYICDQATLICEGIDSYCSTLPTASGPEYNLPFCNWTIQNAHYIRFVAGSSFLEMEIIPSNCSNNPPETGIQAGIFEACDFQVPIQPIAYDCGIGELSVISLTALLEEGQTYILLVDGFSSGVCDYEINVLEGTTVAPDLSGQDLVIDGPEWVLNESEYSFSVDMVSGAADYNWTVDGGEILEGLGTNEVLVQVSDENNFTICVDVSNDCSQTENICQNFEVNPDLIVIEESLCAGECFEINNSEFCETGTFEVEVDNGPDTSYYRIILTILPEITEELDEHICDGDIYELNGVVYTQSGTYTSTITAGSVEGCDSIIILNLTVLGPDEPVVTAGNTGDLDCNNPVTTLTTTSSFPGLSYQWSGPGINAGNENEQSPQVDEGGVYTVTITTSSGCTNSASTEVFGEGAPDLTIEGNNPLNCNNHENTITVNTGGQDAEFEWSGPGGFIGDGPDITVDEPGDYILVVNYGDDCTDTTTIVVTENQEPLFVDPGPNRHIQCEFILTLDAPGAMGTNVIYEWTTVDGNILAGENTLNPVVNTDGTYTLTATDLDNGCTGSADMIVYADMAIIDGEYLEITCNDPTVQIDASESYSGPDASFQWSTNNGNFVDGENTLTPTVDAGGVYQLVIFKPGCISFATVVVVDNAIPPTVEIDASSTVINCFEAVTLTAETNASNPQITWFRNALPISADPSITTTTPGNYTLEVVSDNGCVNSATIFIEEDIDPDNIFLVGDIVLNCSLNGVGTLEAEVDGSAPFYNIDWFTNDGEFLTGPFGETVTILGPGVYCATATNPNTGCSVSNCIDVIEISNIEIDAFVQDVSCPDAADGAIILNVSGGEPPYTYNWSNGEFGVNEITNLEPGNYSVTVTDINGCEVMQLFTIEVDGTEAVLADAGDDLSIDCLTNFLVLDGGASQYPPGSTFLWETNDGSIDANETTLNPSVSSTGTYTLTILSPEGCVDSDQVVVDEYEADAGPDLNLDCNNPEIELAGTDNQTGSSYVWTTNDGNIIDGENTLNPTVNATGTYTLEVTLANGCTYSDQVVVDEDLASPDISIENTEVILTNCFQVVTLVGESDTPNATFEWEGPGGASNSATLSTELPGVYELTVTGPNGCSSTASAEVIDQTVSPEITFDPAVQYINCFNGDPLKLGLSIASNSNNLNISWTTNDGNILEEVGQTVLVDQAGTYTIEVEDQSNDCVSTASIVVEERDAEISIESTIASCGIPDATATVNTTFIHDPTYLWSTGETTATIGGLAPDTYSVTVSSVLENCEEVLTIEVFQDPSCFVIVSGYIYEDPDLTCDLNGNIAPKSDVVVTISPEDLETLTDENGYYEFLVPPGEYTVTPDLVSPYVVECPSESIQVSVPPGSSGSENNNFFVKALSGFDLYVTAGSGSANAGSNQFYQINFCNNWFTTIFGTVEFTHDPLLEFDWMAAGASSYDPLTYTAVWEYEDLSFFECEFFSFQLFVPEDIPDGTVITSSVVILPTQGDIAPENNSTSWTRTVNNSGNTSLDDEEEFEIENTVQSSGEEEISILRQYPNPFHEYSVIEFELKDASGVYLEVLDASGRLIKSYEGFADGFNQVEIKGDQLGAQGIYFYRIIGPKSMTTGRMVRK